MASSSSDAVVYQYDLESIRNTPKATFATSTRKDGLLDITIVRGWFWMYSNINHRAFTFLGNTKNISIFQLIGRPGSDKHILATGDRNGDLTLWDTRDSHRPLRVFHYQSPIKSLVVGSPSPNDDNTLYSYTSWPAHLTFSNFRPQIPPMFLLYVWTMFHFTSGISDSHLSNQTVPFSHGLILRDVLTDDSQVQYWIHPMKPVWPSSSGHQLLGPLTSTPKKSTICITLQVCIHCVCVCMCMYVCCCIVNADFIPIDWWWNPSIVSESISHVSSAQRKICVTPNNSLLVFGSYASYLSLADISLTGDCSHQYDSFQHSTLAPTTSLSSLHKQTIQRLDQYRVPPLFSLDTPCEVSIPAVHPRLSHVLCAVDDDKLMLLG